MEIGHFCLLSCHAHHKINWKKIIEKIINYTTLKTLNAVIK